MCGIIGIVSKTSVNQLLYDGLLMLQHRGQDAAGIVTSNNNMFHKRKDVGLVRDVFHNKDMISLLGNMGIGHVRYPTSGSYNSSSESQPFYVNSPFGIVLSHNGNLINAEELSEKLFKTDLRHVNTKSDSEVLLNVLAHELQRCTRNGKLEPSDIFAAVSNVHKRCKGAYSVVAMIAGYGLLAFRDTYGIRPLVFGSKESELGTEYIIASESVALDALGFNLIRDVNPGEAIFIEQNGNLYNKQCAKEYSLNPCIFEYVYLARPDSIIDGISVYEARLNLGEFLAEKISKEMRHLNIDVVIPIPDSSRPCALQLANKLNIDYREGFVKNRYSGRTFIMPNQQQRQKSVRQKLNAVDVEFKCKNVLLVDDSIVRGTTSREIVEMAKNAGANKIFFASSAPPVKYSNVYGIDMPTQSELIASNRNIEEIRNLIQADYLIYQDMNSLFDAVSKVSTNINNFEASCFDGKYITKNVSSEYLKRIESKRNH